MFFNILVIVAIQSLTGFCKCVPADSETKNVQINSDQIQTKNAPKVPISIHITDSAPQVVSVSAPVSASGVQNGVEKCVVPGTIALTFDDGPSENTRQILKVLNKHKVTATFFINGINVVRKDHKFLRNIVDEGHTLGTHTFSHPALEKLSDFNILREMYDNEFIFRQVLNKRPRFFRPPYFSYSDHILKTIENFGYTLVLTNLDTYDWEGKTDAEILNTFSENLVDNNKTSFISLQHEQVLVRTKVLDDIITLVKKRNYKIVSLKECLGYASDYFEDEKYGPNMLNGIQSLLF